MQTGETGRRVELQHRVEPEKEFMLQVLYVQEVVTLQKKYSIYLHQEMRFTPFINYYDTSG